MSGSTTPDDEREAEIISACDELEKALAAESATSEAKYEKAAEESRNAYKRAEAKRTNIIIGMIMGVPTFIFLALLLWLFVFKGNKATTKPITNPEYKTSQKPVYKPTHAEKEENEKLRRMIYELGALERDYESKNEERQEAFDRKIFNIDASNWETNKKVQLKNEETDRLLADMLARKQEYEKRSDELLSRILEQSTASPSRGVNR